MITDGRTANEGHLSTMAPVSTAPTTAERPQRTGMSRSGLAYAISAYGLWGFLPIYFLALAPTGPVEIVAWRILLSLVFCALLITASRTWRSFGALMRDRRVDAKFVLLEGDPNIARGTTTPYLREFPTKKEDLFKYDLLIIGDVDPNRA
jgi:hypothetical protein